MLGSSNIKMALKTRRTSTPRMNEVSGGATWLDDKYPATRVRQGATQKPDFDTTNMGLLFPQNDPDEIAYIIAQMNHDYYPESAISPHIHFLQDQATTPTFKIDYRWYENNSDPTGAFTTLTVNEFVFPYTSGSILQIAEFPMIEGNGIDTVSSMLDIKLYRDDNDVSGDVLVKEFDIHYQRDTTGSWSEYIKYG